LPGAIILALLHIMTSINATSVYWNKLRTKIACC
jgi:hypothetical protein